MSKRKTRESIKLRRFFLRPEAETTSSTTTEHVQPTEVPKKYRYILMKAKWEDVLPFADTVKKKLENDPLQKIIKINKLNHETDAEAFANLYNVIFVTAPDPYRAMTPQDALLFKEDWTYLAWLYGKPIGFISLTIEEEENGKRIGVIAGIGVIPNYRRRKIALRLALKAYEFFQENNVSELVCEVYEKNHLSYNFIKSLGFKEAGEIYL